MKNTLVKSAILLSTVAAGCVSVAPAQAAFIKGTCSLSDVTGVGTAGTFNATACQNFAGNNNNYLGAGFQNYINSAFGLSGSTWKAVGYSDVSGDPVKDLASGSLQSGNWGFNQTFHNIKSPFVITVKAGNFFAAYLFKNLPGSFTSGAFDVKGATTGNNEHAALSHLSIYNEVGAKIPTPALLPGLIAMGASIWRKRKAGGSVEAEAKA